MNFLRSLIIAGVVIFASVYFGSNYVISQVFQNWLGTPVAVGSVRWGFSNRHLIIKNMRLRNPQGYSKNDFARISSIEADYDPSDLRRGLLKFSKLEVVIDEVRLERKSISESNILELHPLRATPLIKEKPLPFRFQIERTKLEMGTVTFQTQLGNDVVTENRKIDFSQENLTELTTPDRVAAYAALLALRSAGWPSLLPTRAEVAVEIQNQVGDWLEQFKEKIQILQTQIMQLINEKLRPHT